MTSFSFSLSDYQNGLARGIYQAPEALCPFFVVDPVLYRRHADTDYRRGDLRNAITELRKRTGRDYFDKTYPLQGRTLDYSARSFPAYRFILPEVMTEDWLGIVDWGKFQRDHVLHQPLCGYIVLKLLDGNIGGSPLRLPNGRTMLEECAAKILEWDGTAYIREFLIACGMNEDDPILDSAGGIAPSIWPTFFKEAAYVAAVFHDLGYPWQYAERLQSNLEGVNSPAVRQNRNAEQIVDLFGNRLFFRALHGYQVPDFASPSTWHGRIIELTEKALSTTHGLPGTLGFLHLNDCVRLYPSSSESPLHLLCVEWPAMAIMMHDMANVYWGTGFSHSGVPENPSMRLSFDKDPLSALITLVDVLQDFERPDAHFPIRYNSSVILDYQTGCSQTEFDLNGDVLSINYRMTSPQSLAIKRSCLLDEYHKYFDPQYGYLDMASIGINHVILTAS